MKTLIDYLSQYAEYHRDRRNIATHFVGIPMILLAIVALLWRPCVPVAGVPLSPYIFAFLAVSGFYLSLDARMGLTMVAVLSVFGWIGFRIAAMPTLSWLGISIGLFFVGWVIQFVGHYFEGKKPAFLDDLVGLIIGPLFIAAEAIFALGFRREVHLEIERRAGPLR